MIEVSGVRKAFGETTALDGVDLQVPPATVLGLLGPNGAGKTTPLRCWPPCSAPTRAGPRSPAWTSSASPRRPLRDRPGRAVRRGRRGAHRPREPGDGRTAVPPGPQGGQGAGRRGAGAPRTSPTPPTAPSGPTPAACGAGSTWAPASWAGPPRADPRRADDRARPAQPHRAVGLHPASWSPTARPCCSPPSTSRRPTRSPTDRRDRPRHGSSPRAPPTSSSPSSAAMCSRSASRRRATWPPALTALAPLARTVPGRRRGPAPHHPDHGGADGAGRGGAGARRGRDPHRRPALRRPSLDDVFLALTGHKATRTTMPWREQRRRPTGRRGPERSTHEHQPSPSCRRRRAPAATTPAARCGRAADGLHHRPAQPACASSERPQLLVFSTIQPIMFVLLFSYVFGGAIRPRRRDYIDFLLPGIIVQTVRLRRRPRPRSAWPRTWAPASSTGSARCPWPAPRCSPGGPAPTRSATSSSCSLMIVVGTLVGFRFHNGVVPRGGRRRPGGAVRLRLLLGVRLHRPQAGDAETAQLAGVRHHLSRWCSPARPSCPTASMPGWLQAFANHQPVTATANAIRHLSQGGDIASPLTQSLLWIAAIIAVFAPLAVARYRKG